MSRRVSHLIINVCYAAAPRNLWEIAERKIILRKCMRCALCVTFGSARGTLWTVTSFSVADKNLHVIITSRVEKHWIMGNYATAKSKSEVHWRNHPLDVFTMYFFSKNKTIWRAFEREIWWNLWQVRWFRGWVFGVMSNVGITVLKVIKNPLIFSKHIPRRSLLMKLNIASWMKNALNLPIQLVNKLMKRLNN